MNVEPEAKTKRVLIVGGSSGMGLALARMLLEEKAEVTIVGCSEATLAKARECLASAGGCGVLPVTSRRRTKSLRSSRRAGRSIIS